MQDGTPESAPDRPTASLDLRGTSTRALGEVRRWIAAQLARLSRDRITDVIQVADELTANAYEHAGGPCMIRVTHHAASCSVLVEVDDDDPATPTLGRSRHGPDAYRGRGTMLVDQLSCSWGVRRPAFGHGRKTVWAEISYAGEQGPATGRR